MKPVRAGDVEFDPCLVELAYRCPDGCPRDRTCCVGLAVEVTRREIRAIDGLMDELAVRRPALRQGGEYVDVFVDDDPGWLIEPDDHGACPFLVRTARRSLCSIHSLALETGREVARVKPASCRHWPILLENHPRGGIRVTVQPHARRIGCVAPAAELPRHPRVYEAFRPELVELCGEPAWARLARAASRRRTGQGSGKPAGLR